MDEKNTYPVLSRIRHSGVVYAPDTERSTIELTAEEAAPLQRFKCLGEPAEPASLKELLLGLQDAGHDLSTLKMADFQSMLGDAVRGVKRADVDAALAEIKKEQAS